MLAKGFRGPLALPANDDGRLFPAEGVDRPVFHKEELAPELDGLVATVIECVVAVRTALGIGLLERIYEACLAHELRKRGIPAAVQVWIPVVYDGKPMGMGYRIDVFVDGKVIVEIKAVDEIHGIHKAQVLSYMHLTGCSVGLLVNFNAIPLRSGIKRFVLTHPEKSA